MTSLNNAQIRWGAGIRSEAADARNRILDAAHHCYKIFGAKTSIRHIATQAKISRPTVYRYFNSGHDVFKAMVRRAADEIRSNLLLEFNNDENFGEYLIDVLVRLLKDSALLEKNHFMFSPDMLPVVHEVLLTDNDYLLTLAESLRPLYKKLKARGDIAQDFDIVIMCEYFNRITISYLTTPSPVYQSDEQLRQLFRLMLAPVFVDEAPNRSPLIQAQ